MTAGQAESTDTSLVLASWTLEELSFASWLSVSFCRGKCVGAMQTELCVHKILTGVCAERAKVREGAKSLTELLLLLEE